MLRSEKVLRSDEELTAYVLGAIDLVIEARVPALASNRSKAQQLPEKDGKAGKALQRWLLQLNSGESLDNGCNAVAGSSNGRKETIIRIIGEDSRTNNDCVQHGFSRPGSGKL